MNKTLLTVLSLAVVATLLVGHAPGQADQGQDPNMPPMPPGHPVVGQDPNAQDPNAPPPEADPADVASADAIVSAYYDVISGPAGQPRNWDRFRSLFLMETTFITAKAMGHGIGLVTITPQEFVQFNRGYFERGGYFERDVHRQVDGFGNMAHVLSTYETRRGTVEQEPKPYSRGINSMQLISNGQRWWIASIIWESERPGGEAIPSRYLPAAETPNS